MHINDALTVGRRAGLRRSCLWYSALPGREGVVWRLCGAPFDDHCYVFFDAVGAERTAKIELTELRDLEPVE